MEFSQDANANLLLQLQQDQKSGNLPMSFPINAWVEQAARYAYYWSWYRGTVLEEEKGKTVTGESVARYPLRINPVRNFARKHAALLFGEVPDTPAPLVKMIATPKQLYGENPTDIMKRQSQFCGNVINEVWQSSSGRSIQGENGVLSQFLGGSVFQLKYVPDREDLAIPFVVRNVYPDYFLPVWSPDDYWDLLEAHVAYRVPARVAAGEWGYDASAGSTNPLFHESWTKDHYSIKVNGKPLRKTVNGVTIVYDNLPNPFGYVPFIYIPRLREGNLYGSSIIPDISGLIYEYNSRTADEGDAVRKSAQVRFVGKNITGEVTTKPLDKHGNMYIDLGVSNPAFDGEPSLEPLPAPQWLDSYGNFKEFIWSQLLRDSGMGTIAFGEDEGSQRSALTLAFRMWPSTTLAKQQRSFWTDGLTRMGKYILRGCAIKGIKIAGQTVPSNIEKELDLAPDWLPMIPRDREQQVNEVILQVQAGIMTPERAFKTLGDVSDVAEEVKLTKEWLQFLASMETLKKSAGKGAAENISSPAANSGLKEEPSA